MPLKDGLPVVTYLDLPTDAAATDYELKIPNAGTGYVIRRVTVSNASGGSSASATFGVFTAVAAGGTAIVADAALTTHTGATVVSDRTVIAPATTGRLTGTSIYLRITTGSGVTGTKVDVAVEYTAFA